jgi:DNA-directed RNA polymerase II subunit RPB1
MNEEERRKRNEQEGKKMDEEEKKFLAECTLTVDQGILDSLLSFIRPRETIPNDVALAHVRRIREPIETALRGRNIHPGALEKLRSKLMHKYQSAQIATGSSVGVELAQSLGACQSQSCLNSFHFSGLTKENPAMLFSQILNTTKLKNTWTKVFLKARPKTAPEARKIVQSSLSGLEVKSVTTRVTFRYSSTVPSRGGDWHDVHCALVGRNPDVLSGRSGGCITLELSAQKMYENHLLPRAICRAIENHFADVVCVPAPLAARRIDLYIPYPVDINASDTVAQKKFIEITCWKQTVANLNVCGVRGASDLAFVSEKGEYFATLSNGSFRGIMNVPIVDFHRTTSNSMWDIYHMFGIEAVRAFIIREVASIIPGINRCHVSLLADRMCFSGIRSISRYSVRTDIEGSNSSLLSCATFEESMEHFTNGGVHARTEPLKSVSASIVCGKQSNLGTGCVGILVDTDKLENAIDFDRKAAADYRFMDRLSPNADHMYG